MATGIFFTKYRLPTLAEYVFFAKDRLPTLAASIFFTKDGLPTLAASIFFIKDGLPRLAAAVFYAKFRLYTLAVGIFLRKQGQIWQSDTLIFRKTQSPLPQKSFFLYRDFLQALTCNGQQLPLLWLCIFSADQETEILLPA